MMDSAPICASSADCAAGSPYCCGDGAYRYCLNANDKATFMAGGGKTCN
jgi:hypothetical protein